MNKIIILILLLVVIKFLWFRNQKENFGKCQKDSDCGNTRMWSCCNGICSNAECDPSSIE